MTSSTDASRGASSAPRGTSNGTCASASVRLARTMRWAIVGSGTRNARAISAVVRPPSRRSVSATRASVDSTGWQDVKIRRSRSSPMSSSIASSTACHRVVALGVQVVAQLLVLALERACPGAARRSRGSSRSPSARRPGCRARPTPATAPAPPPAPPAPAPRRGRRRARCAPGRRSGAAIRCGRPPRSRGWCLTSGAVTAPDQTIFSRAAQAPVRQPWSTGASNISMISLSPSPAISRKRLVSVDDLFPRIDVHQREAADQLLGLRERPVRDGQLALAHPDLHSGRARLAAFGRDQLAGLGQLIDEGVHLGHHLGRGRVRLARACTVRGSS